VTEPRDRGAVLPLVALVLTTLIAFASFAVDLGFERVARRDMQALADVVALDLSRYLDGRTVAQIQADPVFAATLTASTGRNLDTAGESRTVTYRLGSVNAARVFSPLTGTAVPTAVEVTANAVVDYFFRPGTGDTTRTAVASRNPNACFSIGSFALNLNTQKSALLNGLLNDALNLSVVSYTGLASAQLNLLDLAAQLGVGTVDELATTNVTYGQLALAAAEILERQGDTANATLLRSISTSVGALAPVNVGQIVGVAPSSDAALNSTVNVLDLIAGGAFLANGSSALSVPGLSVNVGGLINLTTAFNIIQGPQSACGRVGAQATTSQVDMSASGNVATVAVPVPALGSVAVQVGPLDLDLDTAAARGTLAAIVCGTLSGSPTAAQPNGIDVSVVTSLLQAGISLPLRITGSLAGALSIDIRLTVGANTSDPTTASTASFRMPPDTFDTARETGSGSVGLSGAAITQSGVTVTATVLGLPTTLPVATLNTILGAVTSSVVNPLITQLDNALLGPITDLFGLNVAGADVFWRSPINCLSPDLVA
jgi:uncharacterized membrane protein